MESAALPENEAQRLAALRDYDVLDSGREAIFDELAELAASICDAPIALITLVDESRQWFKARVGLDVHETARSVSFCAHAILQPGLFVVPDTLQDARFVDNPLVTASPHIRFYAGAPLFTPEGYGLGTLCVIDQVPRELTAKQQKTLAVLRTHILKLLELRRKTRELDASVCELETYGFAISNDLRVPLRAITGFSRILLEDHAATLNVEAQSLLQRIVNATLRMDQVIDGLAMLSRLSRQPLQFWNTNLSQMAHEVSSELAKADPTRRVDVIIQPELTESADPGLLRIVIKNLLDNAWKYTSKRTHARIEFGAKRINGKNEYFVQDNGVGFEMAYAGKLFKPFQRLNQDPDYPGSGVGLAIVKRIIERHGGALRAESIVNQGTTIRFMLHSR